MDRRFLIITGSLLVAGIVLDGYALYLHSDTVKRWSEQLELAKADARRYREQLVVPTTQRMSSGENFAGALQKLGLSPEQVNQATAAAQRAFNLRQLRAGNTLTVGRSLEGSLREINYKIDAERMLQIVPQPSGFSAEVKPIPTHTEVTTVNGTLDDSLFNAVEQVGESAEVAMRLAQIFGYDLD